MSKAVSSELTFVEHAGGCGCRPAPSQPEQAAPTPGAAVSSGYEPVDKSGRCGCCSSYYRSVWDRLCYQLFGYIPAGMDTEQILRGLVIWKDDVVLVDGNLPATFQVTATGQRKPLSTDIIYYKEHFYNIGGVTVGASDVYTCTECLPIEASVIEVYKTLVATNSRLEANEIVRRDRANQDHDRADADHDIASADHQQYGDDHFTAGQDHAGYEADHVRAASDHLAASGDRSRAEDDHAVAQADHSTAQDDHSRADNDHLRADGDHARAEQDHQTVGRSVLFTPQSLTAEQKAQARTNIGAGTYSKPSGGIPASDLADGVIPDVSQFITRSVNDLVNYYLKSEVYTKDEVAALIGAIQQFHYEIAESTSAVTSPSNNVLYLIGPTGSGSDKYEEYVYSGGWVKIGDTSIDLSGYVTTQALNTALAGYVTSEALQTALAAKQDKIDANHKLDYSLLENTPTIPTQYAGSPTAGGFANKAVAIPSGEVIAGSTDTNILATVDNFPTTLTDGVCAYIRNNVVASASGFTLNINGTGEKPVYQTLADASRVSTVFNANSTYLFVYNSKRVEGGCWDLYYGFNSNDNTVGYNLRTNGASAPPAAQKYYRYRLLFTAANGLSLVPANTSSSTSATDAKTVNQTKIDPFGVIFYYSYTSAVNAAASPNASYLWMQYNGIALGYSFNRTGEALEMTARDPVYLKCAPQSDGSAIIDADNPIVQALPTTADGKIYIFLGFAESATAITLYYWHPVYYHDGTGIKLWTANPPVTGNGEDIDQNEDGKLQFANRVYNAQQPNGMGYKILRKDATFASQVTETNTIYEIRYDFSLDDVVSLPIGCKLVFNGGSLNLNGTKITNTRIDALSGGMIPNLQSFANYNAERLVALINAGFTVDINDPYYIGVSETSIAHNVELSGKGKLIKTTSAISFEISAAISLHLSGLSLIGDYPAGNEVFSILFGVPTETHILNESVIVENCSIDNVRVYSHIGDDVDQTTTKDGVKSLVFRNNIIKNIGYYCARLDNCLTDYVEISDNRISNFRTIVFSIAVNNNYQALPFNRTKNVVITGNYVDNEEYVMASGATATYHTPFVIEAETCVFNNNTIKNILCTATNQVGVYAGYLSAGNVEMRGNYIFNVINLGNSVLNECFKAKGGNDEARRRVICGNTYIVTSDIVSGYTPSIMFFSLQGSNSCELLNISDNTVEIPDLDFAWGAGTNIVYKNAAFCRNYVVCKSIASSAREMFRLSANPNLNGEIYVAGNRLICKNLTSIATTLLKEASGYKCTFEDNEMYGFVSFGQYETNYENLEIVSRNNKWILSGNTSSDTLRAYNVSYADDEIILSASPQIRLYPDLVGNFSFKFHFRNNFPSLFVMDWSGNNSKGLYKITIENALGTASVRCRADEETVTILNDAGTVISCSRKLTEASQNIVIPLTQSISLGTLTTTGKQMNVGVPSTYFNGFPITILIDKVSTIPNANAFANRNSLSPAGDPISGIRPYMVWKNSRLGYVMNGRFYGANGLRDGALSGATADRPALASADKGFIFFDTTLGKSIVWNGSAWVNIDGTALS